MEQWVKTLGRYIDTYYVRMYLLKRRLIRINISAFNRLIGNACETAHLYAIINKYRKY